MRGLTLIIILLAFFSLPAMARTKHVHHKAKHLTEAQVAHVLRSAGFSGRALPIMTCIAKHESNFNPEAINVNRNRTRDYGLLQINDTWKKHCNVSAQGLKNPYLNAKCAAHVYKKQGFNAWMAFQAHRRTCLSYRMGTYTRKEVAANNL